MAQTRFPLALGAAVFFLSGSGIAVACSCLASSPREKFEQADAVFVGEVRRVDEHGPEFRNVRAKSARVKVLRSWKGAEKSQTLVVEGGIDLGGLCGIGFKKGARYLILAHKAAGQLSTSTCEGTSSLEAGKSLIAELEKIKKPER